MSPEASNPDEEMLDRLFGTAEEIAAESARTMEIEGRLQAQHSWQGRVYIPRGGYSQQSPEINDDWESMEVGND